jgi:uncharacterized membrane protein
VLAESFFARQSLGDWGFRWLHILAGIMWIGLLYYFNFVQVPAFAAFGDEARARNIAIDKVARKALWWFRWAAVSTFVTGILITIITPNYFSEGFGKSAGGIAISLGMLLGIIMMLNVWGVIWRNQKVVLANAANVLGGGEANPDAPAAGRKAVMASRQNAIFSVSMLFFMVFKGHNHYATAPLSSHTIGTANCVRVCVQGQLQGGIGHNQQRRPQPRLVAAGWASPRAHVSRRCCRTFSVAGR